MPPAAVHARWRIGLPRRPVLAAALAVATLTAALLVVAARSSPTPPGPGRTCTYYLAADKVRWNYAPAGRNLITGEPFDETAEVFVKRGPGRIGHVYLKARFREYTDATFATRKPVSLAPTACSTPRAPRVHPTTTAPRAETGLMTWYSPDVSTPTPGRCRSEPGRGRWTPARSCGCTTPTSTSRATPMPG